MFIYSGDGPDDSVAAPWRRTETKKGVPNQSIMATRSLTYANFRRVARCYVRGVPWAERPGLRSIFDRYNAAESRHEKKLGRTRGWRNSRNRSVRKPDDGGCSMTSSWLSRCPRLWGLGGRSYPWRRARSAKDPLQLRVRAGLFCAALLCPARTLLGRMGLALSPCRGMLLTQRAFEAALPPYQEWV
jgi:hypothetical protein